MKIYSGMPDVQQTVDCLEIEICGKSSKQDKRNEANVKLENNDSRFIGGCNGFRLDRQPIFLGF